MMISGPSCFCCPDCGAPHLRTEIASGNTFRSWLFSDGKMEAPMLPDVPFITKCYRCGLIFYLDSSMRIEPTDEMEASAKYASFLSREGYGQVIRDKFFRTDPEEYRIRLRYLWSFNDPFRRSGGCPDWSVDEDFTSNIERLLELTDLNNSDNLLFAAELNRLAGKFDRSEELLDQLENKESETEHNEIIHEIRMKNLVHDARLFIIRRGEN